MERLKKEGRKEKEGRKRKERMEGTEPLKLDSRADEGKKGRRKDRE